ALDTGAVAQAEAGNRVDGASLVEGGEILQTLPLEQIGKLPVPFRPFAPGDTVERSAQGGHGEGQPGKILLLQMILQPGAKARHRRQGDKGAEIRQLRPQLLHRLLDDEFAKTDTQQPLDRKSTRLTPVT